MQLTSLNGRAHIAVFGGDQGDEALWPHVAHVWEELLMFGGSWR